MQPYGKLERVENSIRKGTGDVSYVLMGHEGWFELKFRRTWPKREDTPIRLEHFTMEQLLWAEGRYLAGGRAGLLVQVAREYFFFHPTQMRAIFNGVNKRTFTEMAAVHWKGTFPTTMIVKYCMRKDP